MLTRLKLAITILLKGGVLHMVDVYVMLIAHTDKTGNTIDDVPAALKQAVLAKLAVLGLDGYGNPLTNG